METLEIIVTILVVVITLGILASIIKFSYRFWPIALLFLVVIIIVAENKSNPRYEEFTQGVSQEYEVIKDSINKIK